MATEKTAEIEKFKKALADVNTRLDSVSPEDKSEETQYFRTRRAYIIMRLEELGGL